MNHEFYDVIRIADKHLAGESVERRKALALEIYEAISRQAGNIANDAITRAFAVARNVHKDGQADIEVSAEDTALIAAAPEMLAELKGIGHQTTITTEHFNRLQRLIAKAEGPAPPGSKL